MRTSPNLISCLMHTLYQRKAKPHRPQKSFSPQQCQETADELNSLYSCPEEGCVKTYQRFSALQHHLDCGRHERALEHETLLDKAAHGYSERLQGRSGGFPELPAAARPDSGTQPSSQMGLGLEIKSKTTCPLGFLSER